MWRTAGPIRRPSSMTALSPRRSPNFLIENFWASCPGLAGVLSSYGVQKGDTVILYMPMIPEAVVAMLACARLGAIHSVVFGGFAPHELAIRIDDARPKLVISASCGIEGNKVIEYKPLLDKAIDLAKYRPQTCILYQRKQATASLVPGRDVDWDTAMKTSQPVGCVPVEATDPLYILYTSGTTGIPKGVCGITADTP